MVFLADPVAPVQRRRSLVRRLWDLPIRAHVAVLGLILVALVPLVGTSSSYLSDEGAAVIQGRSLASGEGWLVPHPLPEVDAEGRQYPLVNSERGPRGFAPLGKHPAYALLVAGSSRLGGVTAMVLLSLVGTLAAAALAGALAGRLDQVLARPAVWAVGLASPLLFDGFLIMGHTLGAALAAAAVLCAAVAITERRPAMALAVAPCVGAAVLMRSEALLFAISLAAVAAVTAVRVRPRAPALLVAGAAAAAGAAARLGEAAWVASIVGGAPVATEVPAPVGGGGFLQGRIDGFVITWLLPDYRNSQPVSVLLMVMVAALAVAAIGARRAPLHRAAVLVPAGLAAIAGTTAMVVAPETVVPGLLMAFPLITAGVVVLRRSLFRHAGAALALATSALFTVAVLLTQYRSGGTGEWGGRYFALAIPIVVPPLLLALYRQGRMMDRLVRRGALGALVTCSAALAVIAVLSLRDSHRYWARFVTSVERAEDVAGPGTPVVTTWSAAPRFAWPLYDRNPWLLTKRRDLGALRMSLADRGFDRFVFVTVNPRVDETELAGLDVIWADRSLERGPRILVVTASGGSAGRPEATP